MPTNVPTHSLRSRTKALTRRLGLASLLITAALAATGCAITPTERERAQLQYFLNSERRIVSTDHFVLAPPDSITIHAPEAKEIDLLRQQIAPDGTISLNDPINRVFVAGLSPAEVEGLLENKLHSLSGYKEDVHVKIEVDYKSQTYYVIGQVSNPGVKPYTGRDTLVATLAAAQITNLGWPQRVYILHPSNDPDKRHATVVNLYDILHRSDNNVNILLAQDDIVYVPLNPFAAVGVAMQNLLFPVEPIISATTTARQVGGF